MVTAADRTAVTSEVAEHHRTLSRWLGSASDRSVLDEFLRAHTDDFSMVTVEGSLISGASLSDSLEAAGNTDDGLTIDIEAVSVLLATSDEVVVRFVEAHHRADRVDRRHATAILRRDPSGRNGLRWLYVHETAVAS